MQHNVFGESAWRWDPDRKQYYYHAHSVDEPDLNLTNPAVIDELDVRLYFLFCRLNGAVENG